MSNFDSQLALTHTWCRTSKTFVDQKPANRNRKPGPAAGPVSASARRSRLMVAPCCAAAILLATKVAWTQRCVASAAHRFGGTLRPWLE
jgi:hypothetical protein